MLSNTFGDTLSNYNINLPFIGSSNSLIDDVAADENPGLKIAPGVEITDLLNVWIQIVTKSEPGSNRLFLKDRLNARILRYLVDIANPTNKPDADGQRRMCGELKQLTSGLEVLSYFVGGIKC